MRARVSATTPAHLELVFACVCGCSALPFLHPFHLGHLYNNNALMLHMFEWFYIHMPSFLKLFICRKIYIWIPVTEYGYITYAFTYAPHTNRMRSGRIPAYAIPYDAIPHLIFYFPLLSFSHWNFVVFHTHIRKRHIQYANNQYSLPNIQKAFLYTRKYAKAKCLIRDKKYGKANKNERKKMETRKIVWSAAVLTFRFRSFPSHEFCSLLDIGRRRRRRSRRLQQFCMLSKCLCSLVMCHCHKFEFSFLFSFSLEFFQLICTRPAFVDICCEWNRTVSVSFYILNCVIDRFRFVV